MNGDSPEKFAKFLYEKNFKSFPIDGMKFEAFSSTYFINEAISYITKDFIL